MQIVKAELQIVLSDEDIDDIMREALEGGITYWCNGAFVIGKHLGEHAYMYEQISQNGKLMIHLTKPFKNGGDTFYELDLEKFKNGVKLWAERLGHCLIPADGALKFDIGNVDAMVCDMIIQYALFGDIVFG